MRYLSVCSGIEATSVAWLPLGFEAVAFSEIEPFSCAVLTRHYPDIPNIGDMAAINGKAFRGVDILAGGTPCQSFSVAGLRKGLNDNRGSLTLEFVRLADECEPAFIVWENVPGILSDRGNAFGCFLAALAGETAPLFPPRGGWTDAGYVLGPSRAIAWRILDAQYFGLAQRRRRVFLVGCPRKGADPRQILFEFDGLRRDTAPCPKKRKDTAQSSVCSSDSGNTDDYNLITAPLNTRAYADNVAQESRLIPVVMDTANPLSKNCTTKRMRVRRLTPLEYERLQGFPDNYTRIAWGKKNAEYCPDTPRYKALGNSMAVPVIQWLGERILNAVGSS